MPHGRQEGEERRDDEQRQHAREDEEAVGVQAEGDERVDFLRDAHRPQLGRAKAAPNAPPG